MLRVFVTNSRLDGPNVDVHVMGELSLVHGKISVNLGQGNDESENRFLREILSTPVGSPDDGNVMFSPDTEPEQFLRSLWATYHGMCVNASEAVDT